METVSVSSASEFVETVETETAIDMSEDALEDVWRCWRFRRENGSDDYLVAVPDWLSTDKFDARRPFFFAKPEYDNEDKGAILFRDVRTIDISIIQAGMYDDVSINEVVELVDISDESDHIDEDGMIWSPRSQQTVFEYDG